MVRGGGGASIRVHLVGYNNKGSEEGGISNGWLQEGGHLPRL